ncbi:MAG: flagellar basal body-associated FliL family protein [Pseudomonadota bacterium]
MKMIITSVVAVVFVAVGSFAGVMLRSPSSAAASPSDSAEAGAGDTAEKAAKDDDRDAKADKKSGDYDAASGATAYFKFSREFVVPLMKNGQVTSLVILHITLETDSSTSEDLFSEEPKLRDNIMTTLITLSNDGRTLVQPTDVNNYETIRSVILMNLRDSISDGIKNVLIVDMAKQDL